MKFAVTITLKKDVLDPQGKVVGQTLKNIGIENLKSIRQGKIPEGKIQRGEIQSVEIQRGKIQREEIIQKRKKL